MVVGFGIIIFIILFLLDIQLQFALSEDRLRAKCASQYQSPQDSGLYVKCVSAAEGLKPI